MRLALLLFIAFTIVPVQAQTPTGPARATRPPTPAKPPAKQAAEPTERQRDCEAQATLNKLRGQTRRNFVADCSRAPRASTELTTDEEFRKQIRDCLAAGEKKPKGAARRDFINACTRKPLRDPVNSMVPRGKGKPSS